MTYKNMITRLPTLQALVLVCTLPIFDVAIAQENQFTSQDFIDQLNKNLAERLPGVTMTAPDDQVIDFAKFAIAYEQPINSLGWAAAATAQPQDFGIVAFDAERNVLDVFGSSTPSIPMGDSLAIPGYQLPAGGTFEVVGAAGYVEAVTQIAAAPPVTESVKNVIDKVVGSADYIASSLCAVKGRPTKVVLSLDAGLNWVFNASTGSAFTWDLVEVCPRFNQ